MATPLNLLILEDRDADALLVVHALRQAGFAPEWRQVIDEADYRAALAHEPELILADYTLPQFDALQALDVLSELGLDIPFIIVSGTIGEETAVAALQRGASDYLLKDRLTRLGMAVRGALQRHQLHREQQQVIARLRDNERRFRALVEHSADGIALLDRRGMIQYVSPAAERITGFALADFAGAAALSFVHPRDHDLLKAELAHLLTPAEVASVEMRVRHSDGSWRWIEAFLNNLLDDPAVGAIVVNYRDITARIATEKELRRYADELITLHQMERRARLQADTLRTTNLALTNSLELDAVIAALFHALLRLVPFERARILLLHDSKLSAGYQMLDHQNPSVSPIPLDSFDLEAFPLLQEVLRSGESRIADLAGDETRPEQSWLGVPMQAHGRMVGLCTIESSGVGCFTSEQLGWAEVLTAQATIAIQNARLFDEVQHSQQRLQTLSHKLIQAQETERRHLARELHDEIGQVLIALQMNLRTASQGRLDAKQRARLLDSATLIERLIQQVRSLSRELRPPLLDDLGLVPALNWHLDQVATRSALQVKLSTQLADERLPPDIELSVFRIVQEALTNIVKHADATRVHVDLRHEHEALEVTVIDNGVGFELDAARLRAVGGASLGLINMQERALLANGTIELISAPEAGTCVRAHFKLGAGEASLPAPLAP
jgi:PAS domain S-box-containing protein